MLYMNPYSAILILMSLVGIGLLVAVATASSPWAVRLNRTPAGKRAAAVLYWILVAALGGQILRAITANWILLLVLAAAAAFGFWQLARTMIQRNAGALETSFAAGIALMFAGVVGGALVRQLLRWQGSIVVIPVIVLIALVAVRPTTQPRPVDTGERSEM